MMSSDGDAATKLRRLALCAFLLQTQLELHFEIRYLYSPYWTLWTLNHSRYNIIYYRPTDTSYNAAIKLYALLYNFS